MKKFTGLYLFIIFVLTSCNTGSEHLPTSTPLHTETPSSTPKPTETLTPKATSTRTPRPTATPLPELTAADVGLPNDPTIRKFGVLPCYVFTETSFHAGDAFIYSSLLPDEKIPILAPIDGFIDQVKFIDSVGWGINLSTQYTFEGKKVYFDLVHLGELASGIRARMQVKQGDILGYLTRVIGYPDGSSILDIAARNDPIYQANPQYWQEYGTDGTEYFPFLPLVEDDLVLLESGTFTREPTCQGNPIPRS